MRKTLLVVLGLVMGMLLTAGPAWADGLIVIHNPPTVIRGHFSFAPLEVVYHKVECDIKDQVAVTSVDQEFYNPNGGRPLEGEYIFPIPKDAQINKFTMFIDGKPTEAELLPAEKARKIYEDIVRASKDPALLEYAGRAMFKVRIFPIEAHSKKRVQLKYTEFLKQDSNLLDYHYTLNTEKFSSKPLKNVSLKVTINTTGPITTLYSPTHEVEIKRHGDTSAVVGFEAKDIRPDTDFHLYIGRKAAPLGMSVLSYRPDPAKEGYFVLLAAPTVSKDIKALPKDVVFVIDTSGSMAGAKIDQAKKALKYCVNTLNPHDSFEIVRFSTEAEPFFKTLTANNEDNRKKALAFIDGMNAAGGTAIEDALKASFDARAKSDKGRLFMVVFLTDGQPTVGEQNPEKLLGIAKLRGADVRIFSFGIGTDVNTRLLDQMAEQTHAVSQYVLPNENIEVSVSNFFAKVQDPIIAGVKLDLGPVQTSKLYPKEMPDLFKGEQLVVFGTYATPGKTAAVVTGLVNGKEQKFAQDVVLEEKTEATNEWIAKLWATRRVGYLLDEIRIRGESKELKDEVVELARKWGVVTPYTAMLIIEDERRRNVPVAARTLREMEADRSAFEGAARGSMARAKTDGADAVTMSLNAGEYKMAKSLQRANEAAQQTVSRLRELGPVAADATATPAAAPALRRDVYGGGGAAGKPAAEQLAQMGARSVEELRLGNRKGASGWNAEPGRGGQKQEGYRVVGNYAQQNTVVNGRAFFLNGNQWSDMRTQKALADKAAKPVKVKFGSEEYFKLLRDHPEAAQYLALGTNVTFEINGTVYDVVEEEAATPAK